MFDLAAVQPVSALNDPLGQKVVIGLIVSAIVGLWAVWFYSRRSTRAEQYPESERLAGMSSPECQLLAEPFTEAERAAYAALRGAAGDDHCVLAKMRLVDLVTAGNTPSAQRQFASIAQARQVDFVICDMHRMHPRVAIAIEQDGSMDGRTSDDAVLESILRSANLPLVRLSSGATYTAAAMRELVAMHLDRAGK